MKMLTDLLGRSLQAFQFPIYSFQLPEKRSFNWPLVTGDWLLLLITLIGIFCLPCLAFAIEPIGTIGKLPPEDHAFLSNETFLRVVPTHIQVVDLHTNAVIDEFGERTDYSDVVFSPTATHLAILNHSGDPRTTTITIWDVNAREQLMEWKFESRVRYAAFSPTDPVFATSFKDGIHLWNWQTGAFIGTMERINFPSKQAIVFSTDGHHLLIVAKHSSVELWNVKTLRLEGRFDGHTGNWGEDVAISPDGAFIAAFETNSTAVCVWDIGERRLLWRKWSGSGRVSSMAFSPDSQRLYVTTETSRLRRSNYGPWIGWDDQVRVWDINSGRQIDVFGDEFRRLEAITLSPDGKTALLHYSDAIVLWDIEEKQSLNRWTDFIDSWWWGMGLSPDGQTLISSSRDFIKIWDVPSGQLRRLISGEKEFFEGFTISPDNKKFAVIQDPWVQVRNLRTGKVEIQFPHRVGFFSEIAFSSSGRWIAAEEDWGDLLVLDIKNPKKLQTIKQEQKKIKQEQINIYYGLAFSKNDEYLAAAGQARDDRHWILLWKRERDSFIFAYKWQVPELHYSQRSTFAFASNTVLAVPIDNAVQIWKLLPNRPKLLKTLDGEAPLHFSSNTRYLFANRNDKLRIWDWREETPMDYPSISAYFALSRDGSVLLSQTDTGQIQIWDSNALLPAEYCPIMPHGKQLVILGEVKRNQLLQNFPNPFNPETWIPFRLADESDVTIRIYNPTGQLVRRLSPGVMSAGDYSSQAQAVYWDGRNQMGESVSSGVYLYTIHAGDFSATRKMLIQK